MNRQDIEWSVNKLNDIYHKVQLEDAGHILFIAGMLEDLGNIVHKLDLENSGLKEEVLHLNTMLDDAFGLNI